MTQVSMLTAATTELRNLDVLAVAIAIPGRRVTTGASQVVVVYSSCG